MLMACRTSAEGSSCAADAAHPAACVSQHGLCAHLEGAGPPEMLLSRRPHCPAAVRVACPLHPLTSQMCWCVFPSTMCHLRGMQEVDSRALVPSLAVVIPLPALQLPLALLWQKPHTFGGISGFTFQSHIKAGSGRERGARGGLSYVFKSGVPEEVLRGWTTIMQGLLNNLCSSASLSSPVCIISLA